MNVPAPTLTYRDPWRWMWMLSQFVPAFVAMGSYTAVVLFKAFNAPLLVQLAGGAITAGLLGLGVGLLTLKLRGIFFSIATVAVVFKIGRTLF